MKGAGCSLACADLCAHLCALCPVACECRYKDWLKVASPRMTLHVLHPMGFLSVSVLPHDLMSGLSAAITNPVFNQVSALPL